MDLLNHISNVAVILTTTILAIFAVIEKSQKLFPNWHPISVITGNDKFRTEIRKEIKTIKKDLADIKADQDVKEINDIRKEILAFSRMLRNNYIPTQSEFQHIHEIYDLYEHKGQNSYIHTEMDYIISVEKQLNNVKK
jgi:hypothetical protein